MGVNRSVLHLRQELNSNSQIQNKLLATKVPPKGVVLKGNTAFCFKNNVLQIL